MVLPRASFRVVHYQGAPPPTVVRCRLVLYRSAALCKQERSCRVIAWFSVVLLLSANKRGVAGLLHGSLSFSANKRDVVGLMHGSLSFCCSLQTRGVLWGDCMVLCLSAALCKQEGCCGVIAWFSIVLCKQEGCCRVIAWFSIVLLLSANKRGIVGLLPGSLSFRCCLQTREML